MTVEWTKYRGPGAVTFTPAQTAARRRRSARRPPRFSAPGEYILHRRRGRWIGRVGGKLRLSLLLDERPGQGHREMRPVMRTSFAAVVLLATGRSRRSSGHGARPADLRERHRADLPGQVHAVPSPRHRRADVARPPTRKSGRGRARSGQRVSNREMPPWHLDKTVGIRQYKNDMLAERRADRDDRELGRRRRAGRQRGRHAAAAEIRSRRTSGTSASPISIVPMNKTHTMYPQGPGLVDRLLRRRRDSTRTARSRRWRSGPATAASSITW